MEELNPYAPPAVGSKPDKSSAIELEYFVGEEFLIDSTAEFKRAQYWQDKNSLIPLVCVFALAVAVGIAIIIANSDYAFNSGYLPAVFITAIVITWLNYLAIDRFQWPGFRRAAAQEVREVVVKHPILHCGTWTVRLDPDQLTLNTPYGGQTWQTTALEWFTLGTTRPDLCDAIYIQTPEFVFPIAPIQSVPDSFAAMEDAVEKRLTERN